jgi:hypothetical protein
LGTKLACISKKNAKINRAKRSFQRGGGALNTLFSSANRRYIEERTLQELNAVKLMSKRTLNSPRAVGDAVQDYLEANLHRCFPSNLAIKHSGSFARRSMQDYAFEDTDGAYYAVDFKTHSLDTKFNMPNITSVERLARFYQDSKHYFILLIVAYRIQEDNLLFSDCIFAPIEMFDWSCLTIGALGWGQIQIANSNNITISETNTRKKWMLELCEALEIFYPNEVLKISGRIDYFKNVRQFWESQPNAKRNS